MPKDWSFYPHHAERQRQLSRHLQISEITARILINRGIESVEDARRFLDPKMTDLLDPDGMKDIERAVERIHHAVLAKERILVFGDYDVDGLSSTALMIQLFRIMRADATYTLPNRLTESYSISPEAAQRIIDGGAKLVITVDNGTTAHKGIDLLNEAGIDVIVTDHHLPGPSLPDAYAIVNPRRDDCEYPFKLLCGAGVAFKLAWALARKMSGHKKVSPEFRDYLLNATAWTALGTVADLVPLVGENRVLAKFGLAAIGRTTSPGLRALNRLCRLGDKVKAEDIAFRLAPRLNAAGRMGRADTALQCLTARDDELGAEKAQELEELNEARRETERVIFSEAKDMVDAFAHRDPVLVLASDSWSPGVIGIVAARLVDMYERPAFLIALNGSRGKGSARTVKGYHLHEAMTQCHDFLLSYGGHAMAAGLEIASDQVEAFRTRLCELAPAILADAPKPSLSIDAEIPLDVLSPRLIEEFDRLGPYGEGHKRPIFASSPVRLAQPPRVVGKTQAHLQASFRQGSKTLRAIGYGKGRELTTVENAETLAVAYAPYVSTFHGYPSVELQITDIRATERQAPYQGESSVE